MDYENDENTLDVLDSSSSSSLLLPTINDNNFLNNHADFKEDFLRLTSMVRRVYFSYLHKSLLSNYAISCQSKDVEDFDSQIKTCASQMELFAVRSALETSLYRKAMTKLAGYAASLDHDILQRRKEFHNYYINTRYFIFSIYCHKCP
ncbi:uncharacterized protein LOC117173929 [Belonocnema kinseyi]|uniref:uncharacterized protein LOC117173929 n=1 Tax=Belonocnema kinseyi TaxID=2817044 RepID=UPI00143D9270|nr:uncharacterized protein LOC117173929 [Belonocnema kinseyi]